MRFSCLLVLLLLPTAAQAEELFRETWDQYREEWRIVGEGELTIIMGDVNGEPNKWQRETVLAAAGRAFSVNPIPVTAGASYCLSAIIRADAGTGPFIGVHITDASGVLSPTGEHWLIGVAGNGNGYGGTVVPVADDDSWNMYRATFAPEAGATHLVIKDELWINAGPGAADFDDIMLETGACEGAASTPADERIEGFSGDAGKHVNAANKDLSCGCNVPGRRGTSALFTLALPALLLWRRRR